MSFETCPHCGAELEKEARACPECGSCEETGWSDDAYETQVGLPDDSFNYDEFVAREFGKEQSVRPHGISWFWWATALVLLAGFFFLLFRSLGLIH